MSYISARRHGLMALATATLLAVTLVPGLAVGPGASSANAVTASTSATKTVTAKTAVTKKVVKKKSAKTIARELVTKKYKKTHAKQWTCLKKLWHRESGWKVHAGNPGGAYGIPQALPGKKMGAGWRHSAKAQIKWGLKYIDGRYGSPCAADSHQRSTGWY
jgi:hypothetical protein